MNNFLSTTLLTSYGICNPISCAIGIPIENRNPMKMNVQTEID